MDLSISQMMQMQNDLFSLHKDTWPPIDPQFGKDFILFMVEEIGEVIAVLKKKGHNAIMEDPVTRQTFLEEMADVLMYYNDILLRYQVTPEKISEAFIKKHSVDMNRNFEREYEEKYNG